MLMNRYGPSGVKVDGPSDVKVDGDRPSDVKADAHGLLMSNLV